MPINESTDNLTVVSIRVVGMSENLAGEEQIVFWLMIHEIRKKCDPCENVLVFCFQNCSDLL